MVGNRIMDAFYQIEVGAAMPIQKPTAISEHFANVEDPRRGPLHDLIDILTIAICAVICGANDFVAIADYGKAKQSWFEKHLRLKYGIPTDDTFRRVFEAIKPEAFESSFIAWVASVNDVMAGEVINIDGKALRRSHDRANGTEMIHLVSAWAGGKGFILGQEKVATKSNEITAIPELLNKLALKGCIVTIDAMGCQSKIASLIQQEGADYVLALKGNQGEIHDAVKLVFEHGEQTGFKHLQHDYHRTFEKGHGRLETREYWTTDVVDPIAEMSGKPLWEGLMSIGKVKSRRVEKDKTSEETRYYLSSLSSNAKEFAKAVRSHWSIENSLHWVLDVAFREDESRTRTGNGAENLSIVRRIALNMLKQEQTAKCGIANKRLRAGWDDKYLLAVLKITT